jgi:hypothetical protein
MDDGLSVKSYKIGPQYWKVVVSVEPMQMGQTLADEHKRRLPNYVRGCEFAMYVCVRPSEVPYGRVRVDRTNTLSARERRGSAKVPAKRGRKQDT